MGTRDRAFEIVCEIQPPTTADLGIVREQLSALGPHCDAFLVPDSHLGRATVSSLAVAHEVRDVEGRAWACLNARDRNLLGLQRDLLTAEAYGVDELLFVYGDPPSRGGRSDLTVRGMLEEVRGDGRWGHLRVGVAADVRRELPAWKRDADVVFTQLTFEQGLVERWRERVGFEGRVHAGVIVLTGEAMARRLADLIPGLEVPRAVLDRLARDPRAGVEVAVAQVAAMREAGVVDGVHLVPGGRFLETARALERVGL